MKTKHAYVLIALTALVFLTPDMDAQDTVRSIERVTRQQAEQQTRQQAEQQTRQQTEQQTRQRTQQFVDLDGDGYNDHAPDHDGDGIPNRLDPDWKKRKRTGQPRFIDLNGDGINDNLQGEQGNGHEQMDQGTGEEDGASLKNQEQRQIRKGRKGSGKSGS